MKSGETKKKNPKRIHGTSKYLYIYRSMMIHEWLTFVMFFFMVNITPKDPDPSLEED